MLRAISLFCNESIYVLTCTQLRSCSINDRSSLLSNFFVNGLENGSMDFLTSKKTKQMELFSSDPKNNLLQPILKQR